MNQRLANAIAGGFITGGSSWFGAKIARYLITRSEFEWLRAWGLPTAAALVTAIIAAVLIPIWILHARRRAVAQDGSTNEQR